MVKVGWKHFQHEQGRRRWSPDISIWNKIDEKLGGQIRYKLGGRLRAAVAGGAALSPEIVQFFIGLGLPILQGYGATETSPVVSKNTNENNRPDSIGIPLPEVEVRIGERDELLTRSPSVMLGYWNIGGLPRFWIRLPIFGVHASRDLTNGGVDRRCRWSIVSILAMLPTVSPRWSLGR